jgi:hypothetical protein
VTASEAYRDGNRGWQTGVKSIRVEDLTSHSDLRPWTNDSARPQHCHDKTWTKTHDMEFTVPDPSPASVVRLRVTVRDYAGKESTQDISYPTVGDWHGTFTMQSAGRYFTRADIILKDDGRGNLTGTMEGQQRTDYSWDDGRCYQRTIRPNNFRVSLVGSHTQVQQGSTLKVFIKEIEETKVIEEIWCRGAVPPVRQELGFKMRVWGGEALLGTPSPLGEGELLPDGSRKYTFDLSPTTANVTMRRVRDEAR